MKTLHHTAMSKTTVYACSFAQLPMYSTVYQHISGVLDLVVVLIGLWRAVR